MWTLHKKDSDGFFVVEVVVLRLINDNDNDDGDNDDDDDEKSGLRDLWIRNETNTERTLSWSQRVEASGTFQCSSWDTFSLFP